MSRSIHTTRKAVGKLARKKFADVKQRSAALAKARRELRRKRLAKRQVLAERRQSEPPLAGTAPCVIPIEVHNQGPFVHYAASPDDLRAVLGRLPPAAIDGLARIQLILGKEYIEECFREEYEDRDPFTGRLSTELFPGVYEGPCFGTYACRRGSIAIHAHVYDPKNLPMPRSICEFYLRLRALTTFVHEVAHHHDEIQRVQRGRWLADRKENVEWYAERMEYQWTREFVLPYLEQKYPEAANELLNWVERQGGVRLPLEFFAGDHRTTERNGGMRLFFSTSGAFESWVGKLAKCPDLASSRLAFAWELHYADKYDLCLQVLDRVLEDKPALSAALTCKADTLIHLERSDEAFSIAEEVLAVEPTNGEAWEVRGDVLELRRDWPAMLDNCDRWLAQVPEDSSTRFDAYQHRAVAYCALGNMEQMEIWIERWANFGKRKRNPEFIRKRVFRRAGKEVPK
jgi:tetratricopeptide (TPR) repeat protein